MPQSRPRRVDYVLLARLGRGREVYCTRLSIMAAVPVTGLTSGVTSLSSGRSNGLCAIKSGSAVWCQESSIDNVAAPATLLRGALPARLLTGDRNRGCALGDTGD